jgi:hypothetical protein
LTREIEPLKDQLFKFQKSVSTSLATKGDLQKQEAKLMSWCSDSFMSIEESRREEREVSDTIALLKD